MIASATPEQYRKALEIVAADAAVDSIIAIFIPPLVTEAAAVAEAIREAAAHVSKPVLASFLGTQGLQPQLAPVPSFAFPESAAVALAHVTRYGEWLRKPVAAVTLLDNDAAGKVRTIVESAMAAGEEWLSPQECEAVLEATGIPAVRSRLVATADEAVAAAKEVGLPVVLKAVGPAIVHKSDVGGVRLALGSESAVRDAYSVLTKSLGDRARAILVQPMVSGAVEMVVGGVNDPSFGPVVMCGLGGVLVDVLDDTAFALCPLSPSAARTLVDRIKGRVCLRGFRGAAAADEAAFCRLLVQVSQVLHACPDIQELDLNPVMALPSGALAADVRIRVGRRSPPAAGRRIHY
jgi:acyl-CoA synthetase (NDP forming)